MSLKPIKYDPSEGGRDPRCENCERIHDKYSEFGEAICALTRLYNDDKLDEALALQVAATIEALEEKDADDALSAYEKWHDEHGSR